MPCKMRLEVCFVSLIMFSIWSISDSILLFLEDKSVSTLCLIRESFLRYTSNKESMWCKDVLCGP